MKAIAFSTGLRFDFHQLDGQAESALIKQGVKVFAGDQVNLLGKLSANLKRPSVGETHHDVYEAIFWVAVRDQILISALSANSDAAKCHDTALHRGVTQLFHQPG